METAKLSIGSLQMPSRPKSSRPIHVYYQSKFMAQPAVHPYQTFVGGESIEKEHKICLTNQHKELQSITSLQEDIDTQFNRKTPKVPFYQEMVRIQSAKGSSLMKFNPTKIIEASAKGIKQLKHSDNLIFLEQTQIK